MKRFCLCSLDPTQTFGYFPPLTGGCSEDLDAFRFLCKLGKRREPWTPSLILFECYCKTEIDKSEKIIRFLTSVLLFREPTAAEATVTGGWWTAHEDNIRTAVGQFHAPLLTILVLCGGSEQKPGPPLMMPRLRVAL